MTGEEEKKGEERGKNLVSSFYPYPPLSFPEEMYFTRLSLAQKKEEKGKRGEGGDTSNAFCCLDLNPPCSTGRRRKGKRKRGLNKRQQTKERKKIISILLFFREEKKGGEGSKYQTAPTSHLLLFGGKEDLSCSSSFIWRGKEREKGSADYSLVWRSFFLFEFAPSQSP